MAKSKIHQVLLKKNQLLFEEDKAVPFTTGVDEDFEEHHWIPWFAWEYLGKPEELTIHVFPGDVRHHFPIPKE